MTQSSIYEILVPVVELTKTFSGEVGVVPAGTKVLLLRFAGCNLSCHYCDTPKSRDISTGQVYTIDALAKAMNLICKNDNIKTILITGGEPMMYQESISALMKLLPEDVIYQIETNGSFLPSYNLLTFARPPTVVFCVDIKADQFLDVKKTEYRENIMQFLLGVRQVNKDMMAPCLLDSKSSVIFKVPVCSMREYTKVNHALSELVEEFTNRYEHFFFESPKTTIFYSPVFYLMGKDEKEQFVSDLSQMLLRFHPFTHSKLLSGVQTGLNFQMHKTWGFK